MARFPAADDVDRTPCVLLVEDEVIIRFNMAEACRELGLTVVEAATADEAWEFIMAGHRPDLVFSDVAMPGSLDGMELCKRIQQLDPTIKLIITSGNLGLRKAPPGTLFFQKPYLISNVLKAVIEVLDRNRAPNDK